jgi:allantoinase
MTTRRVGMDHSLYRYSPVPGREPLKWPGGARVAVCVYLYFEYMEFDQPRDIIRDPRLKDRPRPDCREYSWYQYGNRVGIFRIIELLDRYGMKATVAANSEAVVRFPYLVEAFANRGYEFAAHGRTANRMITSRMTEDEERTTIESDLDRIERGTGTRPMGWIGQDYAESTRTPAILSELGLSYLADWPNDDQPFLMLAGKQIVSLPNQCQWDDMHLLWDRRLQMPRYPQIVGEAFDQLCDEGEVSGRFFELGIHPWLLGAPHRIRYLDMVLAKLLESPHIWQAVAADVAKHVIATATPGRSTINR